MSSNLKAMHAKLKKQSFYLKTYGDDLIDDELAERDIFLECNARMQVHCHFCDGKGHTYRQCITKKEMDKTIRGKHHRARWGTWKGEFFSAWKKKKGIQSEDDRKKREKEVLASNK